MVNTINPAETNPGEVFEGTVDGERLVLFRRSGVDSYPWESLDRLHDHEDVSDLVRLVPARPITRDDLPERLQVFTLGAYRTAYFDFQVRDALAGHLNANGGVPAGDGVEPWPEVQIGVLEYACARWRRAHSIVEGERDQARRERDEWKQEHDLLVVHGSVRGDTYAAMARDRDDWRDKAYSASEGMRKAVSRAEAAEARTTPAVTVDDIEECVYGSRRSGRECDEQGFVPVHIQEAVEQLCDLFGIDAERATDPVEEKAEELMRILAPETEDRTWGILTEPAREDFRRLARHVLGQEAGNE